MRTNEDLEAQVRGFFNSCRGEMPSERTILAFARRVRAEEYDRLYQKLVDCISADTAGDFDLALVQLIHNVRAAAAKKVRAEYEEYHGHEKCVAKSDADHRIAKEQEFWRSEVKKARAEAFGQRVLCQEHQIGGEGQPSTYGFMCGGCAIDLAKETRAEALREALVTIYGSVAIAAAQRSEKLKALAAEAEAEK